MYIFNIFCESDRFVKCVFMNHLKMTNICQNFTKTRVGPTKNQVITKKSSSSPKGTCKGTLKVKLSKYIQLFKRQSLKFLFLHVSCLVFSQKNDILGVCVEENMGKKLKNWSHCLRIQQKRAHTKENWHSKEKCEHVQTN